ncbi:hypothetical protein [Caldalkalibacillus salinus]|uniref:hypothetical protein n=1 Tax=Caldalkalibacillus salinus TaxID=2803787 RepID=UPI001922177B|nr:hypothetical protein [Caldalkalibacillus salinus]
MSDNDHTRRPTKENADFKGMPCWIPKLFSTIIILLLLTLTLSACVGLSNPQEEDVMYIVPLTLFEGQEAKYKPYLEDDHGSVKLSYEGRNREYEIAVEVCHNGKKVRRVVSTSGELVTNKPLGDPVTYEREFLTSLTDTQCQDDEGDCLLLKASLFDKEQGNNVSFSSQFENNLLIKTFYLQAVPDQMEVKPGEEQAFMWFVGTSAETSAALDLSDYLSAEYAVVYKFRLDPPQEEEKESQVNDEVTGESSGNSDDDGSITLGSVIEEVELDFKAWDSHQVLSQAAPPEEWIDYRLIRVEAEPFPQDALTIHLVAEEEGVYGAYLESEGHFYYLKEYHAFNTSNHPHPITIDVKRREDVGSYIELAGRGGATSEDRDMFVYLQSEQSWVRLAIDNTTEEDLNHDGTSLLVATSRGSVPSFVHILRWNGQRFEYTNVTEATGNDYARLREINDKTYIEVGDLYETNFDIYQYDQGILKKLQVHKD